VPVEALARPAGCGLHAAPSANHTLRSRRAVPDGQRVQVGGGLSRQQVERAAEFLAAGRGARRAERGGGFGAPLGKLRAGRRPPWLGLLGPKALSVPRLWALCQWGRPGKYVAAA
ncbi:unnamed protein product, partial [Prorocentrum cordatum]